MNKPVTSTEFKTVIKNLPPPKKKKKIPGSNGFTGEFYQNV